LLSKKAQQNLAAEKAGQLNMFEHMLSQRLPVVMGRILEITEVESDTYETVRAKEAADQAVRELKAPFQAIANLWVTAYFDHHFSPGDYDEALGLISKSDELMALPAVAQAQAKTTERNFFHWELAFPEVFYDLHGQHLRDAAGFAAVIGNPPWGGKENLLTKDDYDYLRRLGVDNLNYYPYFIAIGVSLLHATSGHFAMVLPDSLLIKEYPNTRKFLLDSQQIEEVIHLTKPFKDVDHDVIILHTSAAHEEG
jgi:hypothetical protein